MQGRPHALRGDAVPELRPGHEQELEWPAADHGPQPARVGQGHEHPEVRHVRAESAVATPRTQPSQSALRYALRRKRDRRLANEGARFVKQAPRKQPPISPMTPMGFGAISEPVLACPRMS